MKHPNHFSDPSVQAEYDVWQFGHIAHDLAEAYAHPCKQQAVEAEWHRISNAMDELLAARDAFVMSRAPAFEDAA